ncbi:MAG: hypothetical protein J7J30_01635 [Candidatus Odinarchaeota archaeon]|nr:hypothetical protein [Candidatus Odinarchaeota archaeon]
MISLINYIRELSGSSNAPAMILDILEEFELICYLKLVRVLMKNLFESDDISKGRLLKVLREMEMDILESLGNIASKNAPLIYLEKIGDLRAKINVFQQIK